MTFLNIDIKQSYETLIDDPLNDFYIPVLGSSISYDRIAGYFSSTSLAVVARGIYGLIKNNGKMRIIASPFLSKGDVNIISNEDIQTKVTNKFFIELDNIVDTFQQNHLKALGWMLQEDRLEIRLAYVSKNNLTSSNEGIFHQKVGVFYDINGNIVTFSGSINETASGWLRNIEEFKVFKSWIPGQDIYVDDDVSKFNEIWSGSRANIDIIDIPKAVKDKLINYSEDFDKESLVLKKHKEKKYIKKIEKNLNLFDYQKDAVNKWIDNDYHLLFEMATGTGKTRTAIGCMFEILKKGEGLVVIIACPQGTLSLQWKKEIENIGIDFDESIVADSTNPKNKEHIKESLSKLSIKLIDNLVIFTTHSTGSSKDFVNLFVKDSKKYKIMFIGDECHGLGSQEQRYSLAEHYVFRIGLSATPQRWFDDIGSDIIYKFFGNKSYEFTIEQALTMSNPLTGKTFLNKYKYIPYFIELTDDELYEYQELTSKINKLAIINKNDKDHEKNWNYLLFKRADITKNAKNKYIVLESILKNNEIKDTIIFVSYKQIDKVLKLMPTYNLKANKITQDVKIRDRELYINYFKRGTYNVLIAMTCLDEGIDIPSASTGILMSSSSNPREYIQRVGRIIRQSDDKEVAIMHDIIIKPSYDRIQDKNLRIIESNIFDKELRRVEDMSKNAINNAEVLNEVYKVKEYNPWQLTKM